MLLQVAPVSSVACTTMQPPPPARRYCGPSVDSRVPAMCLRERVQSSDSLGLPGDEWSLSAKPVPSEEWFDRRE